MGLNESLEYLKELNTVSIFVRLVLASIFGGIVGIGKELEKKPAGLRTHILVCIGATLAMMTNIYIWQEFDRSADPTRISAQVISGIGFLGAGTIIITGKNKVKGLSTAAGLWACACMGLAIGVGFYEAAILGCVFIVLVSELLSKIDRRIDRKSKRITLYIVLNSSDKLIILINKIKKDIKDITIYDLDIHSQNLKCDKLFDVLVTLRIDGDAVYRKLKELLDNDEGIIFYQELK